MVWIVTLSLYLSLSLSGHSMLKNHAVSDQPTIAVFHLPELSSMIGDLMYYVKKKLKAPFQ